MIDRSKKFRKATAFKQTEQENNKIGRKASFFPLDYEQKAASFWEGDTVTQLRGAVLSDYEPWSHKPLPTTQGLNRNAERKLVPPGCYWPIEVGE